MWFNDVEFQPRDSLIAGLPLSAIDSSWAQATVLTTRLLPASAFADSIEDPVHESDFAAGGDFNQDGVPDTALVGVYRTHSDSTGKFLLVLTRAGDHWAKAFLAMESGRPLYSSVLFVAGRLAWADCRRCDFTIDYGWDGKRYVLLPDQAN